MLNHSYTPDLVEAGCDEAGRGCLAGPVFAAAVILPPDFDFPLLNDSKKMSEKNRTLMRYIIEENAVSYAVAKVSHLEIDRINILNASIKAMHKALQKLNVIPQLILVDGNRFKSYENIPHKTIVGGDALYMSIAAASVLAKTYRDEYMQQLHEEFPVYLWNKNKGYATSFHYKAIEENGICKYHRKSFNLNPQLKISF
ncbi:MAG: ribonuclease HII [Bacteroidetes bacterium]|nr:ribonuclease HII [Bacteroidota bacterium]